MNKLLPRLMDAAPPGLSIDGIGAKEAHKERKLLDPTHDLTVRHRVGVGDIVVRSRKLTFRRLVALALKQLVADSHFDVVRLGGKEQQRFVLSLPAKARDRAIVRAGVNESGY